ncbi:Uncharacterized protein FWK35_00034477 [Aphis craccivora]|uniref:Uncharacterized protein n=1 Tax=Aphis craccivora TaxID=307492 RepID=A0A6G0YKM7_APHCR|nr:Uncharacterized protein FWK35_00034477 [Aphis craccivora]
MPIYILAHYNIWSLYYNTRYYYYYSTFAPVSAPIRRARTGTGSEGDSRQTGRVNPAPRPLVRAMYTPAGLVAEASTCDVRRMRRGPNTCPRPGARPPQPPPTSLGGGTASAENVEPEPPLLSHAITRILFGDAHRRTRPPLHTSQ